MKKLWRFAAVSLGPGVVLFVVLVAYTAIDVYVRGNCDPKFGCFGSVQFAALITGLILVCSFFGNLLASLIFRTTVCSLRGWWLICVVAGLALGQGVLVASMERLLSGGSVISMMVAWATISCGKALGVLFAVRSWSSNNSLKPNPLRDSA